MAKLEVWLVGLACTTVVVSGALIGGLLLPLQRKGFFPHIMCFLLALAVGSLVGTTIILLIPESLLLAVKDGTIVWHGPEGDTRHVLWKCCVIIVGIYFFYLWEQFMKALIDWRIKVTRKYKEQKTIQEGKENEAFEGKHSSTKKGTDDVLALENSHSHSLHVTENEKDSFIKTVPLAEVDPVAWMLLFGDAMHCIVDGMTIGAAFSFDLTTGLSICIAIVCEQFPHEFGDFAILINAGMRVGYALLFNFLAASHAYIGFIIGMIVGDTSEGAAWIFALASGMFLYLALADMLPELNHIRKNAKNCSHIALFFWQNMGMVMGFGIMVLMGRYGGEIKIGGGPAVHQVTPWVNTTIIPTTP